ncbi:MAG: metalloregulator ArsR/SmtB family transcription factor [Coriobacteriales bacterium]|nr:metalloregulator ArsR/SmtB family transcription factor [Coriobacteriales bacterium]
MTQETDTELHSRDVLLCNTSATDADSLGHAAKGLPGDELIYKATQIFSAMADSTRFKILASLANGELCVCELQEICEVSQSAVSHQLRLLRDIDLVRARRDGQRAVYRLSDNHVLSMLKVGIEHASEEVGN